MIEPNKPELKLAMAKLLPEEICIRYGKFFWGKDSFPGVLPEILETEWLFVMQMVEQSLDKETYTYANEVNRIVREGPMRHACYYDALVCATFNQRATAMCKVKGIKL